jgi:hypothetical protein
MITCGSWQTRAASCGPSEIEFLVRAAQFNIAFQRDGVVTLHERVQQFVQRDRLFFLHPLFEIVTLQYLADGGFCDSFTKSAA